MTTATLAAIVLGFAALGGLTLAGIWISGRPRSLTFLAIGHGAIAALGLILLICAVVSAEVPELMLETIAVLVLAALGGAVLFLVYHVHGLQASPISMVIGHGLTAIAGLYILLLVSLFHGS